MRALERYSTDVLDALDGFAGRATLLSVALAGEQMIGELGHALLANPSAFDQTAEAPRAMWMWHLYEEVEHQAALYDGWMYVFGEQPGARTSRVVGAAYVALILGALWPAGTWAMLRKEDRARASHLAYGPLANQFFGNPGLFRGVGRNLVNLAGADFHPFDSHDPVDSLARNRHLVDASWERPRPSAGRHGTATDVPRLEPLRPKDLRIYAAFAAFVAKRTKAFVDEVRASDVAPTA